MNENELVEFERNRKLHEIARTGIINPGRYQMMVYEYNCSQTVTTFDFDRLPKKSQAGNRFLCGYKKLNPYPITCGYGKRDTLTKVS